MSKPIATQPTPEAPYDPSPRKSGHTPGPWRQEYDGSICMGRAVVLPLRNCAPDGAPLSEFHANAALIAAAPDLLQAVRDLYAELLEHAACRNPEIDGLIARAEGRKS